MSPERKYHRDIYFPAWFEPERYQQGTLRPEYSGHARIAAAEDRYGPLELPERIGLGRFSVIEMRAQGQHVTALVIRGPHTPGRGEGHTPGLDICLVLKRGGRGWGCATVWANERNDEHRTLNRALYEPAPF